MKTAIYPGTFDPITVGHRDIIKRALSITDKLIVAVAKDIQKTPIFSSKERVELVKADLAISFAKEDFARIKITEFEGLLVDFAKEQNANILVRGLRAVSDFEYEFQMAAMNNRLASDIQTVMLPASENTQFIASRTVKEVARLGGDISEFVSNPVQQALLDQYKND